MDFTTDPVVTAKDANDIIDTDFIETVSLTENDGIGTGTFTNEAVIAVAGVATFTGLTLNHNNNGTFQLKFQGKDKPTTVRVSDINGKEMYSENLQNFAGNYEKEINLSDMKKGIYLLQVVQGSKAVNRKIIIE